MVTLSYTELHVKEIYSFENYIRTSGRKRPTIGYFEFHAREEHNIVNFETHPVIKVL